MLAKNEPDHRAQIREAVASGDLVALTRLFGTSPAAHNQYRAMMMAGEVAAAAEQGLAKRARTPADVPEAEVNRWRERIRGLLKAKDQKHLDAARRKGGAGFQAAWIAMTMDGEKMTF